MKYEEETIVPTRLKEKDIRCRVSLDMFLDLTVGAERATIKQMEHNVSRAIPEPCASCSGKVTEAFKHEDIAGATAEVRAYCRHGRNAHCPDELPMTLEEVENNFKKFGQNIPPKPVEIKEELPTSYGDW